MTLPQHRNALVATWTARRQNRRAAAFSSAPVRPKARHGLGTPHGWGFYSRPPPPPRGGHAGEIGVPPYFAKRLSFPERVTPWNSKWLGDLVTRGADEHPGAIAVEDENGRITNLKGMPRHVRLAWWLRGQCFHGCGCRPWAMSHCPIPFSAVLLALFKRPRPSSCWCDVALQLGPASPAVEKPGAVAMEGES
jgi:hypothetical protein